MTTHSQRTMRRLLAAMAGLALVTTAATATTAQTRSDFLAVSIGSIAAEQALARRWAELFAFIIEEFKADGRDMTGILQGDFSTRELRILTTYGDEDSGVGITFTDAQLAQLDPRETAARLYRAWKAIEDSGIGR